MSLCSIPHWKDQSKANRPEKCNLLWVLSCAQQCKGPWGCAKNTLRPQYNLVQYLCLMDLVYNYCSTCSSCGQFIARDSCWRDFYISVILRLNFETETIFLLLRSLYSSSFVLEIETIRGLEWTLFTFIPHKSQPQLGFISGFYLMKGVSGIKHWWFSS